MDCSAELIGPVSPSLAPALLTLYSEVSCGFPSPAEAFAEPPLSLDELVRIREPSSFMVRARGESMIEVGIYPGDVLIVDRAARAKSGDIIVARVGSEFTVKTLLIEGEKVSLVPENKTQRPIVLGDGEELEVWAVATWNLHSLARSK